MTDPRWNILGHGRRCFVEGCDAGPNDGASSHAVWVELDGLKIEIETTACGKHNHLLRDPADFIWEAYDYSRSRVLPKDSA